MEYGIIYALTMTGCICGGVGILYSPYLYLLYKAYKKEKKIEGDLEKTIQNEQIQTTCKKAEII